MKKVIFGFIAVAVLVAALGTAGLAYAQSAVPPVTTRGGIGMNGGRGRMSGGMMGVNSQEAQSGILHDEMVAVFAQKLGLTVDELNARLVKGETMAQIAASKGYSADQFTTLMVDARSQAIDQAVKAGEITQTQADWMKQRSAGMGMNGRGAGQGRFANPNCPYSTQTNP